MAAKPTLMIKGKLVPPSPDGPKQPELDNWIPSDYIVDWFKTRMSKTGIENRVLILKSETASGKSTMLPPVLYREFIHGRGEQSAGLVCTQPRVITAIANVMEILKFNADILRLGETIGWSTGFNKLRPKVFGLLSATVGTLAQQLRSLTDDELISKYKIILIDETHERDLQTDMTIYMLKNFLMRNAHKVDCPFVSLMSATFDPDSFLAYFNITAATNFIWCRGEAAGFDKMWEWNENRTVNDYPRAAATVVEKIVTENPDEGPFRADILIFMPGSVEISTTADWLRRINKKLAEEGKNVFLILRIDGDAVNTENNDYKNLTYVPIDQSVVKMGDKIYKPNRRVIISTVVAETGLTLYDLKYVVDCGYNREIEFNPILGIRGLLTKPAPKSRVAQRMGRAGRKFRGVFYPLYPEYIYNMLPDLQFPQILVEDISPIILDIINEQLKVKYLAMSPNLEFSCEDIDMIDAPTPDALAYAIEKVYTLGYIGPVSVPWRPLFEGMLEAPEEPKFGLTKLGVLAFPLNIPPQLSRMIIAAYYWECSVLDMITIAAYTILGGGDSFTQKPPATEDGKQQMKKSISWGTVYKDGLPGFVLSTRMLYKMRLLICDEFINGLILFNAVKLIINSSASKNILTALSSWCSTNNISYKLILEFIRTRDEIIEQFLTSKFNVFIHEDMSLLNSKQDNFMDIITRLKYCIYDGFKLNIAFNDGGVYRTQNGIELLKPKLFVEDEIAMTERAAFGFIMNTPPAAFIYKELSLKYNHKTSIYEIKANQISVLDGFVNWDVDVIN